jgi:putative FmdB family regulatory protein
MPVYAFHCGTCGGFDVARPMAEAGEPAACPHCGAGARRVFSPPGVARLAKPMRRALDLEERSAHEPNVVSQRTGRHLPHRHEPSPAWVLSH